jgi:hypothetical protein
MYSGSGRFPLFGQEHELRRTPGVSASFDVIIHEIQALGRSSLGKQLADRPLPAGWPADRLWPLCKAFHNGHELPAIESARSGRSQRCRPSDRLCQRHAFLCAPPSIRLAAWSA